MRRQIEPPSSVVLLVGREDFRPPTSFGGQACAASTDCVAVAVAAGPTLVTFGPEADTSDLMELGRFEIETEGLVSLRDVRGREYETIGVPAGPANVVLWSDDPAEPSELVIVVSGRED